MKRKALALAVMLMSVLLVGCGGAKNSSSDSGSDTASSQETFVATYPADFISIAPLADESANTKAVLRNMHEGIYKIQTDGSLEPGVAEKIDVAKDGDYLVFDIVLKKGVKFHNGKELTSEDVKYSYERLAGMIDGITPDKVVGSGYFKSLLNGKSEGYREGKFEIIDDHHIKVYTDPSFGTLTTMYQLADGLLVPSNYSEEEQEKHPVGLGPYEFVEYDEGDHITMKAFKDYYGKKPYVQNVEFRKYADASTLPLAFENGEIDLLNLNNENYDKIKEEGYEISEGLSNDVRVMYMNQREGKLFSNKDLREAVNYAVDKEKMLSSICNNRGAILYSHFTPVLKEYYNDALQGIYAYNPEKAKEALAKAGYPDGLDVTIKTVAENNIEQDIVSLIIEDLEKVGIHAKNEPIPWTTYYEEVYKGYNYDLALINIVGYPDPSRILSRYEGNSGKNMPGYVSEKYDRIMNEARNSVEQGEESINKYKELQKLLAEDAVGLFTIDPGVATAMGKGYKGYKNYPFAFTDISLIERN